MKLHLPKMLRVALLSAMVSMAAYNAYAEDTKLENASTTKTLDSLTVSGTDRVGYIDSSDNLYTKFNNNTRTQNLTINGDMTIAGNGHVAVGGGNADGGSAAYLKVTNGTLTVKDNAQLDALGCQIKDLVIEGGTVRLDTTSTSYCGSGNSSYNASSNKQSTITNSLTISGGELYMGAYNGAYVTKGLTSYHCSAGFKGTINQTGGLMSVRTDAAFNGAATINQTGTAESTMYFTEQMEIGTSLTINQSNDNATLGLGRLTGSSTFSSKKVIINQSGKGTIKLTQGAHFGKGSTIAINQTGDGTIDFCDWYTTTELAEADRQNYRESVRRPYTNQNATYTIEQSGKGTINLDSKAAVNADSVSVGEGAKLNVQGTLTTEELTLSSGAKLDNTGTLTVGSGTAGAKGSLTVTSDGVLNAILDGTNAAINVGASAADTDTVTSWTMASGSVFGIGFTEDWLADNADVGSVTADTESVSFDFNVLVATGTVDLTALQNSFTLIGLDSAQWSLGGEETWVQDSTSADPTTNVMGTLVYKPIIEIDEDVTLDEDLSDGPGDLKTGLDISGATVTINGDNSYTLGTNIGSEGEQTTVILGHENALGDGPVTTAGDSTLIAADDVTAVLPDEVQNSGTLTIEGAFEAGFTPTEVELPAAFISTEGKETPDGNGFYREEGGTGLLIVNNDPNGDNTPEGSLYVEEGTTVVVDGTEYELSEDGLAGKTGPDYSIYYIRTEGDGSEVSSSEILDAAGLTDVTVEMSEASGELTANTAIAVESTAGTLKTTADAEVSGTLTDTTIEASGGIIAATIEGASTVTVSGTDTTTISGGNTYTGGTKIDGGVLEIDAADSLGTGDIELANGGTLDLNDLAVTNNIKVTGCTLMGGGAYDGDLEVTGDLVLTDATTANKLLMSGAGKISGPSLTVDNVDVKTDSDASIAANFTLNENGIIALYNGVGLNVTGSLTLNGVTTLKLEGDYKAGDTLVSASEGLTAGEVVLDFVDDSVMLEQTGNSLVLALKYKRELAEPIGFANWGIASASRAFVDSVHGQRNNTACMADGRGTVWFTIVTGHNDLYGTDVNVTGAVIGADLRINSKHLLGIALGYVEGDVSPTGFRKVEQEGSYAAVYGEHLLKPVTATDSWTLDWTLAYGVTDSSYNGMSWEQDSVQIDARVSRNHKVSDRLGVNGFVGLEYFATDSATVNGVHTGSIQNLRGELGVGASYVLWGMPAVTDAKSGSILRSGCERLVVSGEISYFSDMVRNDPTVRMNGVSGGVCNPGRNGVEVEVGATYRFNARWSASVNYSYSAMEDSNEHRLNIGASWTF